MAIFAIFQILLILRVLTVFSSCFFLIEQFSVIIGFSSLLFKFSFSNSVQICLFQKVRMKKLRVFCVNLTCVRTPCVLCRHALELTIWKPE